MQLSTFFCACLISIPLCEFGSLHPPRRSHCYLSLSLCAVNVRSFISCYSTSLLMASAHKAQFFVRVALLCFYLPDGLYAPSSVFAFCDFIVGVLTPFSISRSAGPVAENSLNCGMPGTVLISPLHLKESVAGHVIVGWWFPSRNSLNIRCHPFVA